MISLVQIKKKIKLENASVLMKTNPWTLTRKMSLLWRGQENRRKETDKAEREKDSDGKCLGLRRNGDAHCTLEL